jgi:hypothetical protein
VMWSSANAMLATQTVPSATRPIGQPEAVNGTTAPELAQGLAYLVLQ